MRRVVLARARDRRGTGFGPRRIADWQREAAAALQMPGPRFIHLAVEPVGPNYHLEAPGPLPERLARFREALAS